MPDDQRMMVASSLSAWAISRQRGRRNTMESEAQRFLKGVYEELASDEAS